MNLQHIIVGCTLVIFGHFILCHGIERTITINGGWSPWSTVATPCLREDLKGKQVLVTCGGGKMTRKRSCTNPVPQGIRPKDCEGPSNKSENCSTNPCDMQWSTWSNCSATCGRGSRERYTLCAGESGGSLRNCKDMGLFEQAFEHIKECNTWNKTTCPSPCMGYNCMEFASCIEDSTDQDPRTYCECQLGRIMTEAKDQCIVPPPVTPTERPIPTLEPNVKVVTTIVTRTASAVLIGFVGATLFLFASLRIYDHGRVIQMNMEIALILAHCCLLLPDFSDQEAEDIPMFCRLISILVHFFFTATFMFIFLESLYTYSLVAFVVKKNGILSRLQNILIGWGFALAIVAITVGLDFEDYGGEYHCWLQVNKPIVFFVLISTVLLVILTFTAIEAAGAANYRRIPGMDQQQLLSARIMQRTNLIIMPMVFVSYVLGIMAEYNQDVALYSTFTVVNACLGAAIFFFHSTGNEAVRAKIGGLVGGAKK